jgi:phosphofructokinase-like protein
MARPKPVSRKRVRRRPAVSGIRRIAINTGGGDAPGLNAVIRAATLSAHNLGWETFGIRDGYNGLMKPKDYPEGGLVRLTPDVVREITPLGGTILGTTNVGNPLKYPTRLRGGKLVERDRSDELVELFGEAGLDALVCIGGDGSLSIANVLAHKGLRVVGVPKTIDNDLDGTVITFGFDTAVSFATEAIDRLHSTAMAHRRIMVVEVMGRYAGWIALHSGVSGTAHAILLPEIPYDLRKVAALVEERGRRGRHHTIVVVAEGALAKGGTHSVIEKRLGAADRLGGVGERIAKELGALTGRESRHVVLGHLLRGGSPTTFDRLLSLRFGAAAVRCLATGHSGVMVALDPPSVREVPLAEATHRMKTVPLNSDTVLTARELGICLGD